MKKFIFILCMILCSCRNLPDDYYQRPKLPETKYNYRWYDVWTRDYTQTRAELPDKKNAVAVVKIEQHTSTTSSNDNILWTWPSILTLGTINLLGWPAKRTIGDVFLKAEVFDAEGKIITKKSAYEKDDAFVACYYGYDFHSAKWLAQRRAYKKAIRELIEEIENDTELYAKASKIYNEKKQKEAKEQARIKAEKKKHLDSVLKDIDNI